MALAPRREEEEEEEEEERTPLLGARITMA
jgi:hypothetical protein